jgi:hypothetical protein
MGNEKPPAAIANLAEIGDLSAHQFRIAQARIIGETEQRRIAKTDDLGAARCKQGLERHPFGSPLPFAHRFAEPQGRCLALTLALLPSDPLQGITHHTRLRGQRLPLPEPKDAVNPGNAGNAARKGCRFQRKAGV